MYSRWGDRQSDIYTSDRPILLTDTDIYRYRYIGIGILISVSVYWYQYQLEKIIKYHIDIGNYKIQISVSVLVESIKAFVEKPLFLLQKFSIQLFIGIQLCFHSK